MGHTHPQMYKENTAHPSYARNAIPHLQTHILEGYIYTAKFKLKHHNSTFRLLLQVLLKSNGRRWPILFADLGHKPVTKFNYLTADIDTPHTHSQGITHSLHEGLHGDKSENPDYPNLSPTTSYTHNINPNITNRTSSGR
jgi:hypothetical protein